MNMDHVKWISLITMFVVLCICTLTLAGDTVYDTRPRVAVPILQEALKLDGELSESDWLSHAAKLTDFVTLNTKEQADEITVAYLAVNKQSLFVGVQVMEHRLKTELQQLHRFKATATEPDSVALFNDDVIELFLSPASGRSYFHIGVNALGTVYDAKESDASWSSKIDVAAQKHEGYWVVEMAIPLASLGMTAEAGTQFTFNVARTSHAEGRQYSSWANAHQSLHDWESFAIAELSEHAVLQAASVSLKEFLNRRHEDQGRFVVHNSSDELRRGAVFVDLIDDAGHRIPNNRMFKVEPGKSASVVVKSNVSHNGDYTLQYRLYDGATDRDIFVSPRYGIRRPSDIHAKLSIKTGAVSQVWVNGVKAKADQLPLDPGVNVIALKTQGQPSGHLVIPAYRTGPGENLAIDSSWKVADKESNSWHDSSFDDAGWKNYSPKLGMGSRDKELFLRKVVLISQSRITPIDISKGLFIVAGDAQHCPLQISSPFDLPLPEATLTVELPAGLSLASFENPSAPLQTEIEQVGREVSSSDRPGYQAFNVHFRNLPGKNPKRPERANIGMVIVSDADITLPENAKIYYRIAAGNVTEAWQSVDIHQLQSLNGKQPKDMVVMICPPFNAGRYNTDQSRAMAKTFVASGFNHVLDRTAMYAQPGKQDAYFDYSVYKPLGVKRYVEAHKLLQKLYGGPKAINPKGNHPTKALVVPHYILNSPGREQYVSDLSSYMRQSQADGLFWDLEYHPGHTVDVSDTTLDDFREFAKLDARPTVDQLKNEYEEQWIEFYTQIWANIGRLMREGIDNSGLSQKFMIYSAYQSDLNKSKYCIDWSYHRDHIDIAAMGYGTQNTSETKQALADVPYMSGFLLEGEQAKTKFETLKWRMIWHAIDGAKGFMLWTWVSLDGRGLSQIADGTRLLAEYEPFFLSQNHVSGVQPEGGIQARDVTMLQYEDEYVLFVFNRARSPLAGKIKLPKHLGELKILGSDGRVELVDANTVACEVPGQDVIAVRLGH